MPLPDVFGLTRAQRRARPAWLVARTDGEVE